jgi:DNA helicase-2/ATP-dependent DNA helicase PcrA
LEVELARRNIPFVKYGGLKFLEAAHVKDVLSVLRWSENPGDRVAGFRVVQLLPGIGPKSAVKILDKVEGRLRSSRVLAKIQVPTSAAGDWPAFAKLITRVRKSKKSWPAEFQFVRQWYEPYLQQRYDNADERAGDLTQLEQIAGGYVSRTVSYGPNARSSGCNEWQVRGEATR